MYLMIKYILVCVFIFASANTKANEMPVLPNGSRPKNMQEVKKILEPLGWDVYRAETKTQGLRIIENQTYRNNLDGALKLDLILPQKQKMNALIIVIHGGGWKKGTKESYRPHGCWLAQQGYAVAVISYRLSDTAKFPAQVRDVMDAIKWLKDKQSKYRYNTDRIVVVGGSAGATLAGLTAVYSKDVSASIVIAGPMYMGQESRAAVESENEESNSHLFFGGSYTELPRKYEQASVSEQIHPKCPPFFLIGEGVNSLERIEFGGKIIPELEKYNIEYDTFILSGGVHGQWNYEPWFSITMSQIDDFVERVL